MNTKAIEEKRQFVHNKIIIGIDPAKQKHQAMVINELGMPYCKTITFNNSFKGFNEELWLKLGRVLKENDSQKVDASKSLPKCYYWETNTPELNNLGKTSTGTITYKPSG